MVNRRDTFRHDLWAEAVIPLEANFPTLRTNSFTPSGNDELLGESLDLIEERRERVMIHLAYYHQKLKQGYDANVKLGPLALGDLVLRKVVGAAKDPSWGKLGPKLKPMRKLATFKKKKKKKNQVLDRTKVLYGPRTQIYGETSYFQEKKKLSTRQNQGLTWSSDSNLWGN